jgi:hypothetical protein
VAARWVAVHRNNPHFQPNYPLLRLIQHRLRALSGESNKLKLRDLWQIVRLVLPGRPLNPHHFISSYRSFALLTYQ